MAGKKQSFSDILNRIQLATPGTKIDPINLVKENPSMSALLSKLVVDPTSLTTRNSDQKINSANIHKQAIQEPSRELARSIIETETIMQMHPDLETAAQILISCILAPEDLTTVEVIYSVRDNDFPSDLNNSMVDEVKRYMEETHNIKAELPKILRSVLIDAGSYPIVIIPENSLDDLINHRVGAESYGSVTPMFNTGGKGILGPATASKPVPKGRSLAAGLEDLMQFNPREHITGIEDNDIRRDGKHTNVSVSDNPALLFIPEVAAGVRAQVIRSRFSGIGTEEFYNSNDKPEVAAAKSRYMEMTRERTFKRRTADFTDIRPVLQKELASRHAVGCPLRMEISPTAAMPVYQPGYPERHIGYFIPIDPEGNPLDITDPTTLQQELSLRMGQGGAGGAATSIMTEIRNQINGWDVSNRTHLDHAARIYASMIEDDLVARLRNGLYGRSFEISSNSEVYRLMLARSLKNDHTTLLYVPAEMMAYFAIRFNKNGTGRSLMADGHVVNAMRSIVTMSNLFRSIRNSVSRTNVNVELDEDVDDPQSAFEFIKGEIIRSRTSMPIHTSDPTEITNWLGAAGYEFSVSGNSGLPSTKIEFSEAATSMSMPDENLEKNLADKSLGVLGVPPEMIANSNNGVDFAAQVWNNHALLNKRVIQIQDEFKPELESYVRCLLHNSETMLSRLRNIVSDHFTRIANLKSVKVVFADVELDGSDPVSKRQVVNWVVDKFVNLLDVSLPRPNSSTLETMTKHMQAYKEALSIKLDAIISTDFVNSDMAGDISGLGDSVKAMAMAHFMRKEMARIGFLPEVDDLVMTTDQGQPVLNLYEAITEHNKGLIRGFSKISELLKPLKEASDNALQNNGGPITGDSGGDNNQADNQDGEPENDESMFEGNLFSDPETAGEGNDENADATTTDAPATTEADTPAEPPKEEPEKTTPDDDDAATEDDTKSE